MTGRVSYDVRKLVYLAKVILMAYFILSPLNFRVIEFVDHLHEHFEDPVVIKDGCYMLPKVRI